MGTLWNMIISENLSGKLWDCIYFISFYLIVVESVSRDVSSSHTLLTQPQQQRRQQQHTSTQKALSPEIVECDASCVSTSSIIAMWDDGLMVTNVRRLRDGEAGAAAAQHCVNIHYTPSDGEAGDASDT